MFTILLLSLPLITNTIQTAKMSDETPYDDRTDQAAGDSPGFSQRTNRILKRSPQDWGDEFQKILTEAWGHEPLGVVISKRSLASCTSIWGEAVTTAYAKLKSDAPSILLSFADQNGKFI